VSSTDQYPQLPPGVAPYVAGIASEFAAIRHGVEEAVRHLPPVITFPPFPPFPVQDTNFVRPETQTALPFFTGWANFGSGFQTAGFEVLGTRVFLRGLVTNTAAALTAGTAYQMAALPGGALPTGAEIFGVIVNNSIDCRVDVNPGGSVNIIPPVALPINSYVTLSGITFSTL